MAIAAQKKIKEVNSKAFIKKRPYLVWYVKNPEDLSEESIIEHTLNYGDFDDVRKLISILGVKRVARIFKKQTSKKRIRINYNPKIMHYFKLYFDRYA